MGSQYGHLTLEERCTIARLHEGGQSIRKIAAALDRPASTISRELKRNGGRQVGYSPAYAQEQAWARRWRGSRLERDVRLRDLVLDRLARGWSPEQVAGRLAREADLAPQSLRVLDDVEARDARPAVVGAQERGEDAHGGRLAGTVGSEETEDAALGDRQVDALQGVDVAEGLLDALGEDRGSGHGRQCTRLRRNRRLSRRARPPSRRRPLCGGPHPPVSSPDT